MIESLLGVFVAIFALLVTLLAAYGAIPPNRIAGLRTNATLRSPSAWRLAHQRAIMPLTITTSVVAASWLLYPVGAAGSRATAALGLAILVAGLLWAWTRGTRTT